MELNSYLEYSYILDGAVDNDLLLVNLIAGLGKALCDIGSRNCAVELAVSAALGYYIECLAAELARSLLGLDKCTTFMFSHGSSLKLCIVETDGIGFLRKPLLHEEIPCVTVADINDFTFLSDFLYIFEQYYLHLLPPLKK